jgi:hypothetical protein
LFVQNSQSPVSATGQVPQFCVTLRPLVLQPTAYGRFARPNPVPNSGIRDFASPSRRPTATTTKHMAEALYLDPSTIRNFASPPPGAHRNSNETHGGNALLTSLTIRKFASPSPRPTASTTKLTAEALYLHPTTIRNFASPKFRGTGATPDSPLHPPRYNQYE